jgi:hypothetical protein
VIDIATDKELSEQAAIAEFTALRNESLQAISTEWNIVAFQLTATAALFSFALTSKSRTGFLLIVPLVSYVLSARYLRRDKTLIQIGRYIEYKLSDRVSGGLKWEEWWKTHPSPTEKLQSFAHGPSTFPIISVVALGWVGPFILHAKHISTTDRSMLGIVWVLDVAATVIAVYTMIERRQAGVPV